MPELPEVENLVRGLREMVVGKAVVDARCHQPRAINLPPDRFAFRVKGRITDVTRRAKSAILQFPDHTIWLHLGLTGRMLYSPTGELPNDATTALIFDDGSALSLARSFMGHAYLLSPEEHRKEWGEYGMEPLSDDFTLAKLSEILKAKERLAIKTVLMDQALIAGIGNVYSDEALHAARIHPGRKAASLTPDELETLHHAIREVLSESIALGGEKGYVDLNGREGRFVPRIHGAEVCGRCGYPAEWQTLGGRKGYYCPLCQPP